MFKFERKKKNKNNLIDPKNKRKLWVSLLNIERFSVGEYNSTFYWISECILSMLEGEA